LPSLRFTETCTGAPEPGSGLGEVGGCVDVAGVDVAGVDVLVCAVGVVGVLELLVPGGALLHAPQPSATAANIATAVSKLRRDCVIITSATVRDARRLQVRVTVDVNG
jgi:hypothetical protein